MIKIAMSYRQMINALLRAAVTHLLEGCNGLEHDSSKSDLFRRDDICTPATRTEDDLEAIASRHDECAVLIVVSVGISIRADVLCSLGVVIRCTFTWSVILSGATVLWAVVLRTSRETGRERWPRDVRLRVFVYAIARCKRWRSLQIPGTPVRDARGGVSFIERQRV
jgi:hypothetical protein